ncbi:MAG: hypothetical protein WCO34_13680 [Betaproteobacteria bacterium]
MAQKSKTKSRKDKAAVNANNSKPKPKPKAAAKTGRGGTFGAAGPCITFTKEERDYWEQINPKLAYKKTWCSRQITAK